MVVPELTELRSKIQSSVLVCTCVSVCVGAQVDWCVSGLVSVVVFV